MKKRSIVLLFSIALLATPLIGHGQAQVAAPKAPAKPAAPAAAKAATGTASESADGNYSIDPAHSTIGFKVRHLIINDIPGRFRDFAGSIKYDPVKIGESSVTFTAKTTSIDTAIDARDKHLRTADFFDVEKYPEMTFKSTKVEKKSSGEFIARGDFTLHGVTKQIAIPFKLHGTIKDPRGLTRLGIEANLTINRQDYGISYGSKLDNGGLVISDDVRINILLEAIKQ